ncbi:MAG: tyrosine-type recombinase/integrase [Acidobacteriota bacterium]
MGVTTRQRKNGNWTVYANWTDGKGHQRANRSVGKSAKEADMVARGRLLMGKEPFGEEPERKRPAGSRITLADYFEFHFLREVEAYGRPKTVAIYRGNFRLYIGPKLGRLALTGLTRDDVRDFVLGLLAERRNGRPLARNTVGMIYRNLSAILNHAVDSEKIIRSPCASKRIRKLLNGAPPAEEVEPLTRGEVDDFLDAASRLCPDFHTLFLCAFHTGMRPGELSGLKWGDIDFERQAIRVRRSVDQYGRVQDTKTEESKKPIAMSRALAQSLTAHRADQKKCWFARGRKMPDWVFPNRAGKPRSMQNVRTREWAKCLDAAGIARRKLYATRHTTATLLISLGANPKVVQRILRHRSITTTLDCYGHLYPDDAAEAVNRLPGSFAPVGAKAAPG